MQLPRRYGWEPEHVPDRWPYTPHRDGWTRWYKGRTVFVCGKTTPLDQVEDRWIEKKKAIDAGAQHRERRRSSAYTLREAASDFFAWLDQRVKTGMPQPLRPASALAYQQSILSFGRMRLAGGLPFADRSLGSFGQAEFGEYARTFYGKSPSTLRRAVANLSAFFSWCKDEGMIGELPMYGRYFARPQQQALRDTRLQQRKSYSIAEIRQLLKHATTEERAWIGLALCGAFDNSDIANLTYDLIDRKARLIDYRRRKTGRVQRLIPIHPTALKWLNKYKRPDPADPAYANYVFLTPTGLPLQRVQQKTNGLLGASDYLSSCWSKLMRRAGLHPQAVKGVKCGRCGKPRTAAKGKPCDCGARDWHRTFTMAQQTPDGRGFRSLRTTFPNLAPRGYRDEVELIMGHTGSILLNHYVEEHGVKHLRQLVNVIWSRCARECSPA